MASIVITSPGSIGTADSDSSQLNSKKPSTANTWEMTFPEKMDEPKASAIFAKRMLFLIVGYYFRLRDLYPSKAFKARRIGDLKISTLNKDVVPKLTKFLMSACKLIDQGYLEKFCVLLNDGKEDDSGTLEVFIVRFAYVKNDVTVTIAGSGGLDDFVVRYTGEDALREATRRVVIRMLMLTEPLKSVPKNAHKEFRIVYTDDTPRDFEADGYRACKHEYNFTGTEAQSITVGSVHAKYHALEASLKSVCMDDELTAEAFSQKLPNELQKTLPEAEKSIPVPYTGIDSITTLVKAREKTKSSDGTMTTSTETSKSTSSGSASASKKPEESTPPIAPLEKSPPKTPQKPQTRSHRAPAPRRRPLVSYEASPSPAPSRVVIEKQPSKKRTVAEEPPVKKPKFVRSIANVTQLAVAIVEADSQ